ncbi:MAG: hypothetical protein O3A00_18105 [Planctomycetota bacterium]|nr:hypothetical protein [Planctomycetota bacterium]
MLLIVVGSGGCSEAAHSRSEAQRESAADDPTTETNVAARICEPYRIEVTGSNYRWHVRYPGFDGRLATSDDVLTLRHVHVPLETAVELVLKSTDYVYVLEIPIFEKKEIAVPSLEFQMEFRPTIAGQYPLLGNELCGDSHPELTGIIVVESRALFLKWLSEQKLEAPTARSY